MRRASDGTYPVAPPWPCASRRRESGLIPWAESGDGINKGLFQQHVNYWGSNYDNYTSPGWEAQTEHPERPNQRHRVDPHGARHRLGTLGRPQLQLTRLRPAPPPD